MGHKAPGIPHPPDRKEYCPPRSRAARSIPLTVEHKTTDTLLTMGNQREAVG